MPITITRRSSSIEASKKPVTDIETQARALYHACQTPKPRWDQLGEATKSVWRERVVKNQCR